MRKIILGYIISGVCVLAFIGFLALANNFITWICSKETGFIYIILGIFFIVKIFLKEYEKSIDK